VGNNIFDAICAQSAADDDGVRTHYVRPSEIEVVQFAPSAEIAPYVTQFYFCRCDESLIHDAQPAALGHLVFFLKGTGTLRFQSGDVDPFSLVSVFGPGNAHAKFEIAGPFHDFGLAFSPLGFAALTGKPARAYADRLVDAAEIFGPDITNLANIFCEGRERGELTIADLVRQTTAFLMRHLRSIPDKHVCLVQSVTTWISSEFDPDVEVLFAQLPMSRSTATRLIQHYFGSSAKQLMRKYRALRAASVLVDPQATSEMRSRVESLFYDQPHMIREIRHFTGRTPGALDGDDSKILRIWLSKGNYQQLEAYPG
jgi:AraC-like DNA-binding protein